MNWGSGVSLTSSIEEWACIERTRVIEIGGDICVYMYIYREREILTDGS